MSEDKTQCPFYVRKYRCKYGNICTNMHNEGKDDFNDCWVAQYWLNATPEYLASKPEVWKQKAKA